MQQNLHHRHSRREFVANTLPTAMAAPLLAGWSTQDTSTFAADEASSTSSMKWYQSAYRRAVIDMHIPDWDERFLSAFDPEQYADMLVLSRSQSIVCYAQSHVGLFNYPTKVGRQHGAWKGRNILGEMIDACHRRGIAVVLYTSLILIGPLATYIQNGALSSGIASGVTVAAMRFCVLIRPTASTFGSSLKSFVVISTSKASAST